MAREKIDRRLAAILSADVVGYSRLMGADEVGTLGALRAHRVELIDPTIAAHNGRVVKLMGDGVLVEFASAIDAVECAVAVQNGMAVRNASVPDDRRIAFRIGVNLGDVIIEGNDIYGDGVNVAARLQELAEPGGVYISGTVFEFDGRCVALYRLGPTGAISSTQSRAWVSGCLVPSHFVLVSSFANRFAEIPRSAGYGDR